MIRLNMIQSMFLVLVLSYQPLVAQDSAEERDRISKAIKALGGKVGLDREGKQINDVQMQGKKITNEQMELLHNLKA